MGLNELRYIAEHKNDPKPVKKYSIPKVSAKKKKQLEVEKQTSALDKDFYLDVWSSSPHWCQNCNCMLGHTAHNFMFHHLLEKRNYPEFRYTPENIMILCLECHSKAETNIDFAPKVKQRRLEIEKLLLI